MRFATLSPDEVEAIHQATLRILSEAGIILQDTEARTLLVDHGAWERGGRVCLPPDLVETCLGHCPHQVTLRGRGRQVTLGAGALHVHNLGGARDVLDTPGGDLRPATSQDVATSTRLLDALENVDTITPLYTPRDVPPSIMSLTMFAQTVRHTLKPINGPGVQSRWEVRQLAHMMQVVLGQAPAVSLAVSPISPLMFPQGIAQAILEIARQGLPFGPLPCPNAGATAPMSLAGALAQQNAEILACIVLAQLVAPGLPVIYCGRLAVLNMRSGAPMWGNPEIGLASAATVQIGHHYHLPVNVYGLADSGYALDVQNGYQRAMNALVPALAGADELSGVGEMAGGTLSSNVQMVVDDEIIGMVQRIRRGFAVDEDTLAVELIAQVMGSTRNFLAEPHTVRYLRAGEVWQGPLAGHEVSWQTWRDAGNPTVVERAQHTAARILARHEVPPLPRKQSQALEEILEAALNERAG
ncbi:MAG: trimethylamine methyltransferase family protein [Anaerolineales bacterium]|nr:MAG: trimethylamine methyltransferase family protein [Anaerolineales bacterium]